jgi:hypothetical protein
MERQSKTKYAGEGESKKKINDDQEVKKCRMRTICDIRYPKHNN